jgi:hypothetical protein
VIARGRFESVNVLIDAGGDLPVQATKQLKLNRVTDDLCLLGIEAKEAQK